MSWLLLDAGNSALKWTLLPADTAHWPQGSKAVASIPWEMAGFAAALGEQLHRASAGASDPPVLALGCSVTSAQNASAIEAAAQAAGAGPVQWLGSQARFDHDGIMVLNRYRDPVQLGSDRWHALIGARSRIPRGALAVVNFGTATTIDGLDDDGRFVGGVIAPGLDLMRASLAQGTARLPLAAGAYVGHADHTDDAIHTGVVDAQIGLVERRVRRIRQLLRAPVHVVVCGGRAAELQALLQAEAGLGNVALEPDLVLRGLWHRARALAAEALCRMRT